MERRGASRRDERYAVEVTRRGMTVRTLGYLGMATGLALAVLLGVSVPGVARTQTLICASHTLNRDDASRLKVAASAAVPVSAQVLIESACVNPGRALGFVETQKVVAAEGVQQWWTMTCHRNAKEWR
jgi:hypothetical protein